MGNSSSPPLTPPMAPNSGSRTEPRSELNSLAILTREQATPIPKTSRTLMVNSTLLHLTALTIQENYSDQMAPQAERCWSIRAAARHTTTSTLQTSTATSIFTVPPMERLTTSTTPRELVRRLWPPTSFLLMGLLGFQQTPRAM